MESALLEAHGPITMLRVSSRVRLVGVIALELVAVGLLAGLLTLAYRGFRSTAVRATASPAAPLPTATAAATARPQPTPTPVIVTEDVYLVPAPTPTQAVIAQVAETAGGLRLRKAPGMAGEIIRELEALATLAVVGRTPDNRWLEVITRAEERGWVSADYVEIAGELAEVPVTGAAEPAAEDTLPYLSGISAHAREIFLHGLTLGNREFAFSLVGDSNTDNPAFLAPFDLGAYDLGEYSYLEPTITYFSGSYSRRSPAAVGSFNTSKVLDPAFADGRCAAGESPLACEYRLHRPSAALILLGTGDQHSWQGFEARYRAIVEYSIEQGVVPVLITKADDLESLENTAPPGYINGVIRRLAREYDVPLLDLRTAVDALPNRGCTADGFHYNSPPDGKTAVFDADHLQYGFTMRNLTALQALDALRRYVLYSP